MNTTPSTAPAMRVATASAPPPAPNKGKQARHTQGSWPRHRADLPDEPTLVQLARNSFFGKPHPDTHNQWKSAHPFVGICQDGHRHRAGKVIFFRPSEFAEAVTSGVAREGLFLPVQLVKEFASIGEGTRYRHHVQATLPDGSKRWMTCFLREELYDVPSLHLATGLLERNIKRATRELLEQAKQEWEAAKHAAEALRLKTEYGLSFSEKEAVQIQALVEQRFTTARLDDEPITGTQLTKMVFEFVRQDGEPLDDSDVRIIRQHLGNPRSELLEVRERRLFILAPVAALPPAPEEELPAETTAEAEPTVKKPAAPEPKALSAGAMQVVELIYAEGMNTSESLIQKRLRLSDEELKAVLGELVDGGVLGQDCYPGGDFREIKQLPPIPNPVTT